jgi:circadian clock protein KaiB
MEDSPSPNANFTLKLYVTGHSPRSYRVISRVYQIAREWLNGACEPIIIDVLEHPDEAERDKILATPTLIKASPHPTRRIIGDLPDLERVLAELGLQPVPEPGGSPETNTAPLPTPNEHLDR